MPRGGRQKIKTDGIWSFIRRMNSITTRRLKQQRWNDIVDVSSACVCHCEKQRITLMPFVNKKVIQITATITTSQADDISVPDLFADKINGFSSKTNRNQFHLHIQIITSSTKLSHTSSFFSFNLLLKPIDQALIIKAVSVLRSEELCRIRHCLCVGNQLI